MSIERGLILFCGIMSELQSSILERVSATRAYLIISASSQTWRLAKAAHMASRHSITAQ